MYSLPPHGPHSTTPILLHLPTSAVHLHQAPFVILTLRRGDHGAVPLEPLLKSLARTDSKCPMEYEYSSTDESSREVGSAEFFHIILVWRSHVRCSILLSDADHLVI